MPTTASEWVWDHEASAFGLAQLLADTGIDISLLTELPLPMQKEIANQLAETFRQPYWDDISKTTGGDAERYLQKGLNDGWSIDKIAKKMRGHFIDPLDPKGTKKYARRRALAIARTEAGNALNGARKASMNSLMDEMGGQVPMRPAWLSVLGTTTRDTHAALDGVPADEQGLWDLAGTKVPWPSHVSLPVGERVNCQCQPGFAKVLPIGELVAISRMLYDGPLVELVTKSGSIVYFTPNHPVLTTEGWVGAGQVKTGMYLFQDTSGVCFGKNEKHEPISIEDMFQSCHASVGGIERRRRLPFQFHGDAKHGQSEIDTIIVDVELADPATAEGLQNREEFNLVFAASELDISQPGSGVAGVGVFPPEALGFGTSSQHAMLFEASVDNGSGNPVGICNLDLPFSRQVGGQNSSFIQRDTLLAGTPPEMIAHRSYGDVEGSQPCKDAVGVALVDASDGCSRFSFVDIQSDEVVGVRLDLDFSGHVYDLQTGSGVYWSQSIIAHNCTINMEFGMRREEAQELISEYNVFREQYQVAKSVCGCGCGEK